MVGVEYARRAVTRQRLLVPSHHGQRIAEAHVCAQQDRMAAQRLFKLLRGLPGTRGGQLQFAQPHAGQRIHAVQVYGMQVSFHSFFIAPGSLQRLARCLRRSLPNRKPSQPRSPAARADSAARIRAFVASAAASGRI